MDIMLLKNTSKEINKNIIRNALTILFLIFSFTAVKAEAEQHNNDFFEQYARVDRTVKRYSGWSKVLAYNLLLKKPTAIEKWLNYWTNRMYNDINSSGPNQSLDKDQSSQVIDNYIKHNWHEINHTIPSKYKDFLLKQRLLANNLNANEKKIVRKEYEELLTLKKSKNPTDSERKKIKSLLHDRKLLGMIYAR